jgi:two-component system sensor histidine kinase KdpD
MQTFMTLERARKEVRGVLYTIGLVTLITIALFELQRESGLTHGAVIYLFPVVIAAVRWGIVASVVAACLGVLCSIFFFYPPLYSFSITDPQEVINLLLFIFVAVVTSRLASRLKQQLEISRQREIDMRDLYDFSRRLAVAFDVSDIHAAIEDHLASAVERKVVLFATAREASASSGRRAGVVVPESVRGAVVDIASSGTSPGGLTMAGNGGEVWLVHAVSPNNLEFGVIAINLGRVSKERADELRVRVGAVLADATATLERLGVAHAISEARMRSQTDQLREALIGSVSHELRTPLASIMGAATVIGAAPALAGESKLKALIHDVHDEAVRLNNDIQNLLDASRISSEGVSPHNEWAEAADIIHSSIDRCRRRIGARKVIVNLPGDLPLIHVDPVLVQQALVQVFDNAAKYSPPESIITVTARAAGERMQIDVADQGAGLTPDEKAKMWDRFFRGERQAAITSGSGLGLWIANAFVAANGGKLAAASSGPGQGTTISIELPVAQAAVTQMESETDE